MIGAGVVSETMTVCACAGSVVDASIRFDPITRGTKSISISPVSASVVIAGLDDVSLVTPVLVIVGVVVALVMFIPSPAMHSVTPAGPEPPSVTMIVSVFVMGMSSSIYTVNYVVLGELVIVVELLTGRA